MISDNFPTAGETQFNPSYRHRAKKINCARENPISFPRGHKMHSEIERDAFKLKLILIHSANNKFVCVCVCDRHRYSTFSDCWSSITYLNRSVFFFSVEVFVSKSLRSTWLGAKINNGGFN